MARNILITGGNRGIGYHLLQKMVGDFKPSNIFATYRDPNKSQDLMNFAKQNPSVKPIQFDLKEYDKFDGLVQQINEQNGGEGINLLINNAGITSKVAKITGVRHKELLENFEVNVISQILLTKSILPLLEKASASNPDAKPGISRAAVVNISSILGSIELNKDIGGMYAYRCSKAALNQATKSMSMDFRKSKIIAIAIHPGWVKTDMGGPKAPLTPDVSVQGIVSLLASLNKSHNGKFLQYDGKELPW